MSDASRTRKVYAIERGTVIDHIPSPMALKVVQILGVQKEGILTVGMNFPSKRLGVKDIVKVENLLLSPQATDRIALVAPTATINIIDGGEVVEKRPIHLPAEFKGLLRCPNPRCITNAEAVTTWFLREGGGAEMAVRCLYCERVYPDPAELLV